MDVKWIFLFVFLLSCTHSGDRNISSSNTLLEVPEGFRQACLASGAELYESDCRCLSDGKFIDPYQQGCPKIKN